MLRRTWLALLLACVACTGGSDDGAGEPSPSPAQTETQSSPIVDQRVSLGYGAKVVLLDLIERCVQDTCSREAGKAPSVKVAEKLPVLTLTFEIQPDSLEASLKTKGRRGEPMPLTPGELVAWRPKIPPGRHDARITAVYGDARLEWRIFIRR